MPIDDPELRTAVERLKSGDKGAAADIPVKVTTVLGKASIQVSKLMTLNRGAVLELDRKVGEPIGICQ